MRLSDLYPEAPRNGKDVDLEPSPAFKRDAIRVFCAILVFIFVYLILFAAAIALAFLCGYGGYKLIVAFPRLHTMIIGLGIAAMGAMVVFFLIKFLFTRTKSSRGDMIEVTEQEQPVLFAFIRKLTEEINAPFPKRIFLSADVNASVFYNSGFWSMFLPVRKNLHIGLGLVNSVNLSEFKAILAHEFGHFSQRSMKFGSYVYHLNQIIYNLLYENDGYGNALDRWASISGYFAFFASVNVRIIQGIQWLLQQIYTLVNIQYFSLSRQMEFHADAVAASVSGANHLVSSLRRLEFSHSCYDSLLEYYRDWSQQCLKPDNLFQQHGYLMDLFARNRGLVVEDGLPVVTAESFAIYNQRRIVIRDQWASHPSVEDREKHLKNFAAFEESNRSPAWKIFLDVENLQNLATNRIFDSDMFETPPTVVELESFREKVESDQSKHRIDRRYKGFYDGRYFSSEVIDLPGADIDENCSDLDCLLNDNVLKLPHVVEGLKTDIRALEMMQTGALPLRTFEFAGVKMKRKDVPALYQKLTNELAYAEDDLAKIDAQVIAFFLNRARLRGQEKEWRLRYREVLRMTKQGEADLERYLQMTQELQPLFYEALPADEIKIILAKVKNIEKPVKARLSELLNDPRYAGEINEEERKTLEDFVYREHTYFSDPNFHSEEFSLLTTALTLYHKLSVGKAFDMMKRLLDEQLTLETEKATL